MKWLFLAMICITTQMNAQTPRITFQQPGLYPEGTAFDSVSNMFYVSSSTKATIGKVDLKGNYTVFYEEPDLKSSFGMKIDFKNRVLWICTGDPNNSVYTTPALFKKQIRLIGLDINTGKKISDIDLSGLYPGKHFANDIILDDQENKYITDSYSPVIYKVDAKGNATVFLENELFKGMGIGLNGIAWNPKGYLLTINDANGNILKIDLQSKNVATVKTSQFFPGGDGLLLVSGKLYLVQNKGVNKISILQSRDDWKTAELVCATAAVDRFQNPSTLTRQKDNIYVLNAKLNELSDSTAPRSKDFSLQLVECKK